MKNFLYTRIVKLGLWIFIIVGLVTLLLHDVHKSPHELVSRSGFAFFDELVFLQESIGLPARIKIPSISIDAAVEKVALTSDGSMDLPKLPFNTAWYEPGPRPGEKGSAVIAGHVDWKSGAIGVFGELHTLKPGDKIVVQDDRGLAISFVVRGSRIYDPNEDVLEVFDSFDAKSHLNLVTCSGVWNKTAKSYSKRLVVFADREI